MTTNGDSQPGIKLTDKNTDPTPGVKVPKLPVIRRGAQDLAPEDSGSHTPQTATGGGPDNPGDSGYHLAGDDDDDDKNKPKKPPAPTPVTSRGLTPLEAAVTKGIADRDLVASALIGRVKRMKVKTADGIGFVYELSVPAGFKRKDMEVLGFSETETKTFVRRNSEDQSYIYVPEDLMHKALKIDPQKHVRTR